MRDDATGKLDQLFTAFDDSGIGIAHPDDPQDLGGSAGGGGGATSGATSYPTMVPTRYPTPLPTRRPTMVPTRWPTFAPTPKQTNAPKPIYMQEKQELEQTIASAQTLPAQEVIAQTPLSTRAPTGFPTPANYIASLVMRDVPAVVTAIPFAVTREEACSPRVKQSMSEGTADSLGLGYDQVAVVGAGGASCAQSRIRRIRRIRRARHLDSLRDSALDHRRRRLASTEVEFEIQSKSNDVTELVAAVQQAAIEGSIVTHVKAKAAKHGCLTEGLKAMPVQVSTARIQEAIVTKEVMVLIRPPTEPPTGHPSRSPTAYPTLHKPASTGLDFLVATFSFR